MAFSIFNSWGPPVQKTLSNSDENGSNPASVEKTSAISKIALKSSSGDKDKETLKVLKSSRENIPAAINVVNEAAIPLPPPSYETRFKLLESTTDVMLSGIETASNIEVDARFYNIPCIQSSRPKDSTQKPRRLHANEVNFSGIKMICTQAPTANTHAEFWNTVCDHKAIIVDLTTEYDRKPENFRNDQALTATPYYPITIGESEEKQGIHVTLKKIESLTDDPAVQFKCHEYVVKKDEFEQTILRVSYSSWNDFQGIKLTDLIRLVEGIHSLQEKSGVDMLIIHCRAGMGRTGTLSTALAMYKMHKKNTLKAYLNTTSDSIEKAVDQLIILGRAKRGKMFVTTVPQYRLLHEFLTYLSNKPSS